MGQILHGSARTTAAVRRAIQDSQESLRVLAGRYGINPKTLRFCHEESSPVLEHDCCEKSLLTGSARESLCRFSAIRI
jgi:hypothetical protein